MDFRRSSISARTEAVGNPLLGFNALQATDIPQVGVRLWTLHQLLSTLPSQSCVPHSFIIPDAVMQAVWRSIDWPNPILKDFPHLNLKVAPTQAVQIQLIAQALQTGILDQRLPPQWAALWQAELCHIPHQPWILTPCLWQVPRTGDPQDLAPLLTVRPTICKAEPEALWAALKRLWAALFQAQQLHIFNHLGLRPAQVHCSILVQPRVAVYPLGWLKISATQFEVEAVAADATASWQWHGWPEGRCYDRNTQSWNDPLRPEVEAAEGSVLAAPLLSDLVLKTLLEVGNAVPRQAYNLQPLTLTWGVPRSAPTPSPQVLSIAADLPFPLPPPRYPLSLGAHCKTAASAPSSSFRSPDPWVGVGVSPGIITAPVVVVEALQHLAPSTCRGAILVTRHLEPVHLPWLQEAVGLLCTEGGQTSHGAILARELGCPAVVGVGHGVLDALHTGQWIVLDGTQGTVQRLKTVPQPSAPFAAIQPDLAEGAGATTRACLLVNASQPSTLHNIQDADGIGLLRGEWLLLGQLTPPYPSLCDLSPAQWTHLRQRLGEGLLTMARAIAPRPLFYRSIDLSGLEPGTISDSAIISHPALGLRGTLRSQFDGQLFEQELALLADLIQQGVSNLRLVLPFVRSPQEVTLCLAKMRQIGLDPHHTLPLWMMAEVPSVLFCLEVYRDAGIQGITIGSSDLTQLLLGIDRDHSAFQLVFQRNGSVVLEAIRQLVVQATTLNLPSILCGVLTQQPPEQWLTPLLTAGLTGLSVEGDALAQMRQAIAQVEQSIQVS